MVSSLPTVSSSTSSNSTSSAITTVSCVVRSQSWEEKIPLAPEEEVERKLASILVQIQQNQVKRLNLASASLGYFYGSVHALNGHKNTVCSLSILKNGVLASGSSDTTIKLWDLSSYSCLFTLQGHTDSVWALAALPNGQLASGSDDTTIKIWNLASNTCFSTLHGHTEGVWALAILPNGQLASGSFDKTVKIWDLASNTCLSTLKGHTDTVWALAAFPNGRLASGSRDTTIKIWNLASNTCFSTLQEHTEGVWALTGLPNGLLASGSFDKTIKLWDLDSYTCLSTLQGHTWGIYALAVLPNGLLASGSFDKTIKLWDLGSYTCLSTLEGHTDTVRVLAVLRNDEAASGSADDTIKLWEPKTLSTKYLSPILNALKSNTSVAYLDLSGNRDILDDIIDPLLSIFTSDASSGSKPNTSLKTIDLRRTGVSKKGVRKLEKAIQHLPLSLEVLSDCPIEWKMIYFLIIFCRANRNSPFADSSLDLCKYGEIGTFLGIPSGFFVRPCKNLFSSKRIVLSPS